MATVSVSKGVFIYKNGAKAASKKSRMRNNTVRSYFSDSLWYKTYRSLWDNIEAKIQKLNNDMFSDVLSNLVNYLQISYDNPVTEIPAACLLTGINMPDHSAQFKTLEKVIKKSITPHVCTLNGEDCQNLKYLIEMMINQLIKNENLDDSDSDNSKIKKSQCNFGLLQSWYEDLYFQAMASSPKKRKIRNKIIVVIIPEFENFIPKILQDFLLIASSYVNVLPFVFVFGVATSISILHRSLPCHVSSRINIRVFHSSQSIVYLNNVLEKILFTNECMFQLGGKVFNLFTDIFLFYDLSVSGFVQNFKYAMMEHFSFGNATALCQRKNLKKIIESFTHEDLENVRRVFSFRKLVKASTPEVRIRLLTDDNYFREVLRNEVRKIVSYIPNLHLFLTCLHTLVKDLPKAPLGKQLRELYATAVSTNITKTEEYKECFQLLSFQSKDELLKKVDRVRGMIMKDADDLDDEIRRIIVEKLDHFLYKIENFNCEVEEEKGEVLEDMMDRLELKEKLRKMSKTKSMSNYEKIRSKLLNFLSGQFEVYLIEPSQFYFHEIFFFNDISIKNHIVGSHRAAIHTALNDPHRYLQCPCCEIPNDSVILPSMPDISIVYKLHLECGKMINLYDWLQAFLSIVDPQDLDDGSKPKVAPELQARFTQAVTELEFLGFIRSSKRKTDHVSRLTWGG